MDTSQEQLKPMQNHKEESATPAVVILIVLALVAFGLVWWLYNDFDMFVVMRIYMGLFFVVFSGFKFLDYKNFADAFATYDLLAQKLPGYKQVYPFIELALGIGFFTNWNVLVLCIIVIVLLSFGAYSVYHSLKKNSHIRCACLGTKIKLPLTKVTLIENTLMVVMAILMIINTVFL